MTTNKYPRIMDVGRGGAGMSAKGLSDHVLLYRNIPYSTLTWYVYLRTARKGAADIVGSAIVADFGPGGIGNKKGGRTLRYAVCTRISHGEVKFIHPASVRTKVRRAMEKRERR